MHGATRLTTSLSYRQTSTTSSLSAADFITAWRCKRTEPLSLGAPGSKTSTTPSITANPPCRLICPAPWPFQPAAGTASSCSPTGRRERGEETMSANATFHSPHRILSQSPPVVRTAWVLPLPERSLPGATTLTARQMFPPPPQILSPSPPAVGTALPCAPTALSSPGGTMVIQWSVRQIRPFPAKQTCRPV